MSTVSLLLLTRAEVEKAITMTETIDAVKRAFIALSAGEAQVPLRTPVMVPEHNGVALFMPAYADAAGYIGVKAVSVFPENPEKYGIPTINAMIMLFDGKTGVPVALMDGEYVTALRTGAASGLATDLLARADAGTVGIFGTGAQARTQLMAVCAVRNIREARVTSGRGTHVAAFCAEMQQLLGIPVVQATAQETAACDIICTATTASEPVFSNEDIRAGAHINGVGSYRPHMAEVPAETVVRARIVADQRHGCMNEAGDIVRPLKSGVLDPSVVIDEIGEIAAGKRPGRESAQDITFFKSVGNAAQDLFTASIVLQKAKEMGLGRVVEL